MEKKVKVLALFFMAAMFFFSEIKATEASTEWTNVGNRGISAGEAEFTQIAFHPTTNEAYVAFKDKGVSSGKLVVKRYRSGAWETIGNGISQKEIMGASMAFAPSGDLFVAYIDGRLPDNQVAKVAKYNGSSWTDLPFSINGQETDLASNIAIAVNQTNGVPYIIFSDAGVNLNLAYTHVLRYSDGAWEDVGDVGFVYGSSLDIKINPISNQPYIEYVKSNGVSTLVYVKKFNGTAWESVGSAISGYQSLYGSLALNPISGEPYVAYSEGSDLNYDVRVKKYSGTSWEDVGGSAIAPGSGPTGASSLAFDSSGNLFAAYGDTSYLGWKMSAKVFRNGSWEALGNGYETSIMYLSLAINPSTGEPYAILKDYGSSSKASVIKFSGSTDTPIISYSVKNKTKKTATVTWATATPSKGYVMFSKGKKGTKLLNGKKRHEVAETTTHSVTLTGLKSKTTYYYKIYSSGVGSSIHRFKTK